MKKIILLASILGQIGCSEVSYKRVCIKIRYDRTEKHLQKPNITDFWGCTGLQEDQKRAVELTFCPFTDKAINNEITIKVPDYSETAEQNHLRQYRVKLTNCFYDSVANIIDAINFQSATSTDLNYSEIYLPIIQDIEQMLASPTEECHLFLYTDLREKGIINSYALADLSATAFADTLEKIQKIPIGCVKITVHVMFEPKTREEDIAFRQMYSVYEILFARAGITLKLNI